MKKKSKIARLCKNIVCWALVLAMLCPTVLQSMGTIGIVKAADEQNSNLLENPGFEAGDLSGWVNEGPAGIQKGNINNGACGFYIDRPELSGRSISQTVTVPYTGTYKTSAYISTDWDNVKFSLSRGDEELASITRGKVRYTRDGYTELKSVELNEGDKVTVKIEYAGSPTGNHWINGDDVFFGYVEESEIEEPVDLENVEVRFDGEVRDDFVFNKDTKEYMIYLPEGTKDAPVVSVVDKTTGEEVSATIKQAGSEKVTYNVGKGETVIETIGGVPDSAMITFAGCPDSYRIRFAEDGEWRNISGEWYDYTKTYEMREPSIHDYSQTLTMKVFCAKPQDPLAGTSQIAYKFDDVLEIVKKVDKLTQGVPKIIYLVGWQYTGHDDRYPSWDIVNENLRCDNCQHKDAADCLSSLMLEAKNYNTTISLHINSKDIGNRSPLWKRYADNDLISKRNGSYIKSGVWGGEQMYKMNYSNEWDTGFYKARVDRLCEMLPIKEAGTIHSDAFFATSSDQHTLKEDQEARRKMVRYWRSLGVDLTTEFVTSGRNNDEEYVYNKNLSSEEPNEASFIGDIPMVWHYGQDLEEHMNIPATLLAGGKINTLKTPGAYEADAIRTLFGGSMHGEDLLTNWDVTPVRPRPESEWFPNFTKQFCTQTVPYFYLNQFDRVSLTGTGDDRKVEFSDGVVTELRDKKLSKDGIVLRENGDSFIPATWADNTIIAYSETGYTDKTWQFLDDWKDITNVDIFKVDLKGPKGLALVQGNVDISSGTITLSAKAGEMLVIRPQGTVTIGREDLEALVKEAKEKNLSDYTQNSVKKLQKTIEKAEELLTKEEVTNKEYTEMYEELQSAIRSLASKNVALNKPVEVSSIEKVENDKVNINDGNEGSRWAAADTSYPQWAIVDLGEEYDISRFVTSFYTKSNGGRWYMFNIYTSNDKENWELVVDESKNTIPGVIENEAPEDTRARYVKLEVTGASQVGNASVYEFEVIINEEETVEVDKADLADLIEYAKSQQENENYKYLVPVVKEAFEKALAEAVVVNDNADATQDEVDAAYDALLEMVGYLDFTGNSESLKVLVDAAKGLNEKLYTPETWEVLVDALAKAEAVLADENALQAEIDAAAEELQNAMDGLKKLVDKSALLELVEQSKEYESTIADYTPETAELFTKALAKAREVLANVDATQKEVDDALAELTEKIASLKKAKKEFDDVSEDDWYYDAVNYVYENNIMNGTTDKNFAPNMLITRSQFTNILYRLNGSPEIEYKDIFSDVPDGEWYTDGILWASSVGITSGYQDGKFGTEDRITREQMATMMYRYAIYKGYDTSVESDLSNFKDSENINDYAKNALEWAVGNKIISGKTTTILAPQSEANRAECATIIMRFMEIFEK